jgi:hypothetical protein
MGTGNGYYFQASWTNTVNGYPNDDVQVQTRRRKVVSPNNWQFLAYANGG